MIVLKKAAGQSGESLESIKKTVAGIIEKVRLEGDRAVIGLTRQYDGVQVNDLKVPAEAVAEAYRRVDGETLAALKLAAGHIRRFAEQQLECLKPLECEIMPGVVLGHRLIPVSTCGAYVPGGRYPLPSTALMSIIPARVAGVKKVVACSPPSRALSGIHPAVLAAMDLAGADEIFCMGGAQAVAAYTYGTGTVPRVDMIVGPGNVFVTEAKRQVSGEVGIDILAGPSEVLIIADGHASPALVACDLLAQCEHDADARGILVTTSRRLAESVLSAVKEEGRSLATGEAALKAWEENGQVILVDSLEEAASVANDFAPEHLELHTGDNDRLAEMLVNYGSLFIGGNAPVAFGDYVSGTNHILPTMGCSRFASGVWAGTFIKVASYQKLTGEGAAALAGACAHLAGVEGLFAHQRSASLRKG
ncbi:MAG TPA: histidinol dehydrogenase [Bacillota bacterium]|nr:histidinol dehydrogenase [Bacillota bacterium]